MIDGRRGSTVRRGTHPVAALAIAAIGLLTWSGAAMAAHRSPDGTDQVQVDDGYPYEVLGGGWQNQRAYGYQGPAGVYSCAQGRVDTYLARKACGGAKFPNRFL